MDWKLSKHKNPTISLAFPFSNFSCQIFTLTPPGKPVIIKWVYYILWIYSVLVFLYFFLHGTGQFTGWMDKNKQRWGFAPSQIRAHVQSSHVVIQHYSLSIRFQSGVLFCHSNLQIQSTDFWNHHPVRAICE